MKPVTEDWSICVWLTKLPRAGRGGDDEWVMATPDEMLSHPLDAVRDTIHVRLE